MAFDSKELLLLTLQRIKCYITQSLRFNYSDSMSIIGLEVLHRSLSDFFPFANVLFFPCLNELEVGGCKEKLH